MRCGVDHCRQRWVRIHSVRDRRQWCPWAGTMYTVRGFPCLNACVYLCVCLCVCTCVCVLLQILRKHATYLISMFMLMIPAQLPELAGPEDIDVMVQRFKLNLTDTQAAAYLEEEINAAMNDNVKTMDFSMHILKHKGGGSKRGDQLNEKLQELLRQVHNLHEVKCRMCLSIGTHALPVLVASVVGCVCSRLAV